MAYIYIVQAKGTDKYKVGIADKADARLANLQTGSPIPLELLRSVHCDDVRWAERFMHDQLNLYRQSGEWFSLDDKQLDAVYAILNIIEDWNPKPKLVSLMVKYGLNIHSAIRQVYYKDDSEDIDETDMEEIMDDYNCNHRMEDVRRMIKAKASRNEILKEVWNVDSKQGGKKFSQAAHELDDIIYALVS